MAQFMSIKPKEGFGKGDTTLGIQMPRASQRLQAIKTLIFQDLKRKISSSAAIMKLASRASAAVWRDPQSTRFERTQQPPQPLPGESCMPFGQGCHCAPNQREGRSWILCQRFTSWKKGERERHKIRYEAEDQKVYCSFLLRSSDLRAVLPQCCASEKGNSLPGGPATLWTAFGLRWETTTSRGTVNCLVFLRGETLI